MSAEVATYSSIALTLGLALARPRVPIFARRGHGFEIGPATAALLAVMLLMIGGVIVPADLAAGATRLWRPFLAVAAMMITTAAVERAHLIEDLATAIDQRLARSPRSSFATVFALSACTAGILNNDAAVLLLTPAVIALARRRYPNRPELVPQFAFAVFLAAGVAPFMISNPMNMVVAAAAGIDFNSYAIVMGPIAAVSAAVTFAVLYLVFRSSLAAASTKESAASTKLTPRQLAIAALLLAWLAAYSFLSPVWLISLAGAAAALLLSKKPRLEILRTAIAWDIFAFLFGAFIMALALERVGFAGELTALYSRTGIAGIATFAALGSAIFNNHPMAMLNLLALEQIPGAGHLEVLAALVGGDLGPRLLPVGSLAGLLWLRSLKDRGVSIPIGRFMLLGAITAAPALAAAIILLIAR